uniref:Uncharacterized protein n=1 Tax=Aegilops tauschii subsp. strangulata TaxID=200361 RepID=A0A453GZE9_AEGTS
PIPFHSSEREEKMLSWKFSRKGATGFSWASTADEVTAGVTASGLTAIVTGASSGIGAETARVLAARGAHVVMAVRNLAAGDTVRQAVLAETPAASVDLMELDVSSLASVRNFAADFAARGLPLNILVYVHYYSQSCAAHLILEGTIDHPTP